MKKNKYLVIILALIVSFASACHEKQLCTHQYHLNEEQTRYICSICGDNINSGKASLLNDGDNFLGDGYEQDKEQNDMQSKKYLFIGSSAANGFHTVTDNTRTSMASMMRDDYLTADFSIYENEKLVEYSSVYLRKISSTSNDGKIEGTYRWGSHSVTLNNNGDANLNGVAFDYYTNGTAICMAKPVDKLFSFNAILRLGDTVHKYTSDGNTISAFATSLDKDNQFRYDANGTVIGMQYSSIGYEGSKSKYERSYVCQLLDAIHDIGDQPIDKVYIQLSTNDIGQFTTAAATEHLPFGSIDASLFDINSFDLSTSFGSMEYLIAKIKEHWKNAEIVLFTCWMMDSDWISYVNSNKDWDSFIAEYSNQDNYNILSEYAKMRLGMMRIVEKWNTEFIDLWADKAVNSLLNGPNKSLYKTDTIHLSQAGYEKAILGIFRSNVDGNYINMGDIL